MRCKSLYKNNISSASNFPGFLFDLEWPENPSDVYICSLVNSVQYHIDVVTFSSFDGCLSTVSFSSMIDDFADGCVILESSHPWMGVLQSAHTLDMRVQKKGKTERNKRE